MSNDDDLLSGAAAGPTEARSDAFVAPQETPAAIQRAYEIARAVSDNIPRSTNRPKVPSSFDLHQQVRVASHELAVECPDIFRYGNNLAKVVERPKKAPGIAILSQSALQVHLSALLDFVSMTKQGEKKIGVPKDLVAALGSMEDLPCIPELLGVVSHPVFVQGRVVAKPGYDETSKLYIAYDGPPIPEIPAAPTAEDIRDAVDTFRDVYSEFESPDRDMLIAVCLSMALTGIAKWDYEGPSGPNHVINGTSPGVGKDKSQNVVAVTLTGRKFEELLMKPLDKDLQALLLSQALKGAQFIRFSNVTPATGSGGAAFNIALTSDEISDREYATHHWHNLPFRPVYMSNGNAYVPPVDGGRRTIMAHLTSSVPKAEKRKFRRKDLLGYVLERRGHLLAACLTILQGYHAAGRPLQTDPLGSFEGWSMLVRDAIVWAELPDVVESQASFTDAGENLMQLLVCGLRLIDPKNEGKLTTDIHAAGQMQANGFLREFVGDKKKERVGRDISELLGRVYEGEELARKNTNRGPVWYRKARVATSGQ